MRIITLFQVINKARGMEIRVVAAIFSPIDNVRHYTSLVNISYGGFCEYFA